MTRLGRRELLQLSALVAGGAIVSQWLRSTAPVGQDLGLRPTVNETLDDAASPRSMPTGAVDLLMAVFTDYQCPACKAGYPAMAEAVAEDGSVGVLYKEWPIFGAASERAARVALAAGKQGIYAQVHESLMLDRRRPIDSVLRETVEAAKGDWSAIVESLTEDGEALTSQLARNRTQAFSLGLGGTPAYLVGSVLVRGAVSKVQFRDVIAQARQAASSRVSE
jgi:protein-disulfide isomerase